MNYRAPDLVFSVPTTMPVSPQRYIGAPPDIGKTIDNYFSKHGALVSRPSIRYWLTTAGGGEATYHFRDSTVLVKAIPRPPIGVLPMSYEIQMFVEGKNKRQLVKELEAQLADFKIPAKPSG